MTAYGLSLRRALHTEEQNDYTLALYIHKAFGYASQMGIPRELATAFTSKWKTRKKQKQKKNKMYGNYLPRDEDFLFLIYFAALTS